MLIIHISVANPGALLPLPIIHCITFPGFLQSIAMYDSFHSMILFSSLIYFSISRNFFSIRFSILETCTWVTPIRFATSVCVIS